MIGLFEISLILNIFYSQGFKSILFLLVLSFIPHAEHVITFVLKKEKINFENIQNGINYIYLEIFSRSNLMYFLVSS